MFLRMILFLIFFLFQYVSSQTSSIITSWYAEYDSSISHYNVYRAVNSHQNFQMLNTIIHQYTLIVDSDDIIPGNLYAYTIVAVDIFTNQSQ